MSNPIPPIIRGGQFPDRISATRPDEEADDTEEEDD